MIELGRWNELVARWGYDEEYEEEGLSITDGKDFDCFYTADEFDGFLSRWGSYGAYHFVFQGAAWEQIPELSEGLNQLYERWGG